MTKMDLTKKLEDLSYRYYNPKNNIFENESVCHAISDILSHKDKEEVISELGVNIFLDSILYKKTIKNDYEIYKEFLGEVFSNPGYVKNQNMYKSVLDKEAINNLICARLRKENFKDWENKDASFVYDFLENYDGKFREKMGRSLYYVVKEFPDNNKEKLLGEDGFNNFLRYKKHIDNSEVINFYEEGKELIANFELLKNKSAAIRDKIAANKNFESILISAKLLKYYTEEGFDEYMRIKEINAGENY